jgi:hypothetical protein
MTKAPAEAGTHAADDHSTSAVQADPDGLCYLAWKSSPRRRRRQLLERLEVAGTEAECAAIQVQLDQYAWMVERGLL